MKSNILNSVAITRFIQPDDKPGISIDNIGHELNSNWDEFIFIRDSNIIRRLQLDQILFVEAMGDYVKLQAANRFFAIHSTLKAVEGRLPINKFLRVHRSYIVAINKIDTIQEGVLIVREKTVPVADAYRAILKKRMNIL